MNRKRSRLWVGVSMILAVVTAPSADRRRTRWFPVSAIRSAPARASTGGAGEGSLVRALSSGLLRAVVLCLVLGLVAYLMATAALDARHPTQDRRRSRPSDPEQGSRVDPAPRLQEQLGARRGDDGNRAGEEGEVEGEAAPPAALVAGPEDQAPGGGRQAVGRAPGRDGRVRAVAVGVDDAHHVRPAAPWGKVGGHRVREQPGRLEGAEVLDVVVPARDEEDRKSVV